VSQINPVHTTPSYPHKIHYNIILHLRLGLPSGHFPSDFPTKILHALCRVLFECGVLFCVMYVICVLYLIVVPLPPGKNSFVV
jgi:hypothetical protein